MADESLSGDYFSLLAGMLRRAWRPLLEQWGHPQALETMSLERPASREHGDLATNLAMIAAGTVKRPPRELAAELVAAIGEDAELSGHIASADLAGPGFINFFLTGEAVRGAALEALSAGGRFGSGAPAEPQKILLEYVSANPTGQLHVGHARYAAYGDSLRRILQFAGEDITSEFYINDYGTQMELFGRSLAARYAQELGRDMPLPEKGYQGDYPVHIAMKIIDEDRDRYLEEVTGEPSAGALEFFKVRGRDLVLAEMTSILRSFRVEFDSWFSERTLHESGAVKRSIAELQEAGELYDKDGALWLATTRYGDDKDRVLIKENGELTYIAADIAYHREKLSRGFDRLINVWGADHHGYVPRMKAALEALSHDSEKLEVIIGQLVNLVELGEKKQMSKRAGTMVTLTELVDSIGVDAARFFLVDRSHDSTLDLDIEKAKMKSEENPVYYVQYAHARISSILRKAEEERIQPVCHPEDIQPGCHPELSQPGCHPERIQPGCHPERIQPGCHPERSEGSAFQGYDLEQQEKDLILKLMEFPAAVSGAASARAPQRITAFARELAATFHVFYHNCPVIKAEPATGAFRLDLCRLSRRVIARCLDLVGVSAPERMERTGE